MKKSGLILLAITAVLWIALEYYNSTTTSFITEAKSKILYADAPSKRTDGELVFTIGELQLANSTILDSDLGLAFDGAKLRRSVEMYQWKKRESGVIDSYDSVWSTSEISDFNFSFFYQNPDWDPKLLSKVILNPSQATINDFIVPNELLVKLTREAILPPSKMDLPRILDGMGLLVYSDNNYVYLTKYVRSNTNIFIPYIGDYRLVYSLVRGGLKVAVAGRQDSQEFVPWRDSVLLISDTARDSNTLLDTMAVSSSLMWFMRVFFVAIIFATGWVAHGKGKSSLC